MAGETLDLTRSVYELCTTHPKVKGVMAQVGFDEITKPGRLQTMDRLMTIPRGCQAKNIALEDVVSALQGAGFAVQGYEFPAGKDAAPVQNAGKDDEVRGFLKMATSLLQDATASPSPGNLGSVADQVEDAASGMEPTVTKEENVLIPLALKSLTATECNQIAAESGEFGYSYR